MAKLALLDMLSIKGKDHQYDELLEELKKTLRDRKNPIVEVEMARIEIEHLSLKKQYKDSARILGRYQSKFTEKCCEQLIRNIPESFIRSL
ncbi:MAG: hypothetical protein KJ914_01610 [Gammaproteobacteria bacterium]|nr:hypothetical protein [Gammaproteobacteria bacterium]MBU1724691.1 hypothetical protein [Gammaproteobacteria bacterium]MBU2005849.1 hypothetical protein [Gammaproteobacteria bacterium]